MQKRKQDWQRSISSICSDVESKKVKIKAPHSQTQGRGKSQKPRPQKPRTGTQIRPTSSARALAGDAAEAHIFDFEELVHSILGTFAAEARFLHAAEGRDLRGNDSGVDADNSVLEGFGDTPNAGHVSPVEVSSQPEFRVIREGHRLRFRLEAEERRDWAEGFFTRNGHLRRDAGENGRLKKAAAECMAMSANEYFCTFGLRVANMAFDF